MHAFIITCHLVDMCIYQVWTMHSRFHLPTFCYVNDLVLRMVDQAKRNWWTVCRPMVYLRWDPAWCINDRNNCHYLEIKAIPPAQKMCLFTMCKEKFLRSFHKRAFAFQGIPIPFFPFSRKMRQYSCILLNFHLRTQKAISQESLLSNLHNVYVVEAIRLSGCIW